MLEPSGGVLLYSINGGAFSSDWGGSTVAVNTALKVDVEGAAGSTNLTVDLSGDTQAHLLSLSSNGTTSTLHDGDGNLFGDLTYGTAALTSLTIDTNPAFNQTLNLNFGAGGNPIPANGGTGLAFNTGNPNAGGVHLLTISGQLPTGGFAKVTPIPNDPSVVTKTAQFGSITFDDGTGSATAITKVAYSGLQPINDTTPALTYTFNDFADDNSFTALSGPVISGFDSLEFLNTPATGPATFETTNIANKTNVIFNTNQTLGLTAVVNIPTASAGLSTLTFNALTNSENDITISALPAGVASAFNSGTGNDVLNVTGAGVPSGTTLTLNGGIGTDTLNFDAGGLSPTVTAGGSPGEVLISLPGFGTVDALSYEKINLINVGVVITPGTAQTIKATEGSSLNGVVVGLFTLPLPSVGAPPNGVAANNFGATINWGDGSATAGTITQNAGNPSVYSILGTHTYTVPGTYTVTNTVAFSGTSFVSTVNGVSVTTNLAAAGPTAGTSATATVANGAISVSADTIVGTPGTAISAGPIATFTDFGGADSIGDYSAEISVFNSTGTKVIDVAAASITQIGNSAEYTVNAPAITLADAGTYKIVVAVTDSEATPFTVSGTSSAVIAGSSVTPPASTNILAFAKQPANVVAGETIKPIVVDVEDLFHHIIETDTSSVTLAIATGPGALIGTVTVSAVNGVATFTNLSIHLAGAYTMAASDGGVTAVSRSFMVSPAAVASVVVGAVPGNVAADATISPAIVVHVFDAFGNLLSGSVAVKLSVATGPVGAKFSGNVTVDAKNGVATFSGIAAHKVGTYTLMASCRSIAGTSGSFTVTPGAAATITFKQIPTTVVAGSPIGTPIIIAVMDKFGNLLTNDVINVTISLSSGPAGGVLGGTKSVALSGGMATFSNLDLTTLGNYTLLASFESLGQRHGLKVN